MTLLVEWNGKTPLVLASDNEHIICMLAIFDNENSWILSGKCTFVLFYYWCTNAKEGKDNGIKIATVDQNWKEALRKSYNRLKKSQV